MLVTPAAPPKIAYEPGWRGRQVAWTTVWLAQPLEVIENRQKDVGPGGVEELGEIAAVKSEVYYSEILEDFARPFVAALYSCTAAKRQEGPTDIPYVVLDSRRVLTDCTGDRARWCREIARRVWWTLGPGSTTNEESPEKGRRGRAVKAKAKPGGNLASADALYNKLLGSLSVHPEPNNRPVAALLEEVVAGEFASRLLRSQDRVMALLDVMYSSSFDPVARQNILFHLLTRDRRLVERLAPTAGRRLAYDMARLHCAMPEWRRTRESLTYIARTLLRHEPENPDELRIWNGCIPTFEPAGIKWQKR